MKKIFWVVFYPLFFLVSMVTPLRAEDKINPVPYYMRIFLHGNQKMQELPFGFSEWVIIPNITTEPKQVVALVGTSFDWENVGIETHIGFDWSNNIVSPIFDGDIFISFQKMIGFPITSWSDLEWILPASNIQKSQLYIFSELDYELPLGLGQIGIETEDTFFTENGNILSIGPHYVLPVGNKNRLMVSYLFGTNQFWFRSFINF